MLIRRTKECKFSDEQLIRNYQNMDETGKDKLLAVSEKVLDIWQIVGYEGENRPNLDRLKGQLNQI